MKVVIITGTSETSVDPVNLYELSGDKVLVVDEAHRSAARRQLEDYHEVVIKGVPMLGITSIGHSMGGRYLTIPEIGFKGEFEIRPERNAGDRQMPKHYGPPRRKRW